MMARRRKRRKSWISWLFIVFLLVAACVVVYLVWDNYFNDNKEQEQTETEVIDVNNKPIENKPEEIKEPEINEKEEIIQYDGDNPNKAELLSGVVTYAGVSGDKLIIRVNINQFLSQGSCDLRLIFENDVNVYSAKSNITDSASTSTCEGFDVPITGFKKGNYNIYINLTSGEKTGTINGAVTL